MCGEHSIQEKVGAYSLGSSPHVRGALFILEKADGINGIIPACAGSTTACDDEYIATQDHPRMCGEH